MKLITAIKSLLLPRPPHRVEGIGYVCTHFTRVPKSISVFLDRDDGTQEYLGEYVREDMCDVVRCIECIHCGRSYEDGATVCKLHPSHSFYTRPNDYCSHGKRSEGE